MKEIVSVFAGVLPVIAVYPYIKDIISGKTKPNIVSWFTWTLLLGIATAAAFTAHQPRTAFLTLGDLIGTGTTVILGIKYGIAKFSWLDGICQAGAVVGLVLWFVFNSPSVAILAALIIDFVAAIPTLNHSWKNPSEETWQTFFVIIVASCLTLFSLDKYSFASLAFPIYLAIVNCGIVAIVLYGRKRTLHVSQRG